MFGRRRIAFRPFILDLTGRGHRDDNLARHDGNVLPVREQRAVLAGRDEVDTDRVVPRVAVRPILDVQQVAIVLLIASHGDRARRRGERSSQALELVLLGKVLAVSARCHQRLDDLARMTPALDHMQQLLVSDQLLQ